MPKSIPMTDLRLGAVDANGDAFVFVGLERVGTAVEYETAPGQFSVHLDEPPPSSALTAPLPTIESGVRSVRMDKVRLLLLGRPWYARVFVDFVIDQRLLFCWPAWGEWRSIFTFLQLRDAIEAVAGRFAARLDVQWEQDEFKIEFMEAPSCSSLGDYIRWCEDRLRAVYEEAFLYAAANHPDAVIQIFHFPDAVAVACEQYLLHFVDFLRDIGVEAAGDVRHEAGRILFSVSPNDRGGSLAAIREALSAYLCLPGATIERTTASDVRNELVMDKLTMNLHHLKAQLAAAGMFARLQESTIAAQELTIAAQQELLNNSHHKLTDRATLIPGLVEVVAIEGKGFRVDLPELIRRLRSLFNPKG